MKAVVISGGHPVSIRMAGSFLDEADYIVCADKGAEYAEAYGVVPDLIVGDMDSADKSRLSETMLSKIVISPREKDYTDTHLAVMNAIENKADEITMLCATGLRSDHFLANIRLLLLIADYGAEGKIVDDENTISLCTGQTEFIDKTGTIISILSIADTTTGITLDGFKYPLENYDAGLMWTTGISNEIISPVARISIESG
ncbi:MAG: thiamine diphosphokinase, partial [Clostridia bacterium]|nr:thiamine diphosphokinase [Clostridia bacterium]